ncbi:MAG: phage holin family protein [Deltaproteobacteria bacterium]|nr:phage holin family protein [Deltaproteobacteria bacterium]
MESSINPFEKIDSVREESVVCQLEEMLTYGSSYMDARIDGLKFSAKESLQGFFVAVCCSFFGVLILFIAVAFVMYGIALGLANALGGNLWLGFVLTGGIVVLGILTFSKIILVHTRKKSLKNKLTKYKEELKTQRHNWGHDMSSDSMGNHASVRSEGEFLAFKAALAKSAFHKTKNHLKHEVSEAIDVKEWTKKYPFYSTGIAAASGFIIAGGISSQTFKEPSDLKTDSAKNNSDEKTKDTSPAASVFVTMLTNLAENVLMEAVVPLVKEHIHSLSHKKIPQP